VQIARGGLATQRELTTAVGARRPRITP